MTTARSVQGLIGTLRGLVELREREDVRRAEEKRYRRVEAALGKERAARLKLDRREAKSMAQYRTNTMEYQRRQAAAMEDKTEWTKITAMGSEVAAKHAKLKAGGYEDAATLNMRKYRAGYFMQKMKIPEAEVRKQVDAMGIYAKRGDEITAAETLRYAWGAFPTIVAHLPPEHVGSIFADLLEGKVPDISDLAFEGAVSGDITDIQRTNISALTSMYSKGNIGAKEFEDAINFVKAHPAGDWPPNVDYQEITKAPPYISDSAWDSLPPGIQDIITERFAEYFAPGKGYKYREVLKNGEWLERDSVEKELLPEDMKGAEAITHKGKTYVVGQIIKVRGKKYKVLGLRFDGRLEIEEVE